MLARRRELRDSRQMLDRARGVSRFQLQRAEKRQRLRVVRPLKYELFTQLTRFLLLPALEVPVRDL